MNLNKELEEILNKYVANYNLEVLGFRQSGQQTVIRAIETYCDRKVLEGKMDMISWALSRTSMDELKERWRELGAELENRK